MWGPYRYPLVSVFEKKINLHVYKGRKRNAIAKKLERRERKRKGQEQRPICDLGLLFEELSIIIARGILIFASCMRVTL